MSNITLTRLDTRTVGGLPAYQVAFDYGGVVELTFGASDEIVDAMGREWLEQKAAEFVAKHKVSNPPGSNLSPSEAFMRGL